MNDTSPKPTTGSDDAYLKSMFYEQLVEHVFVSEVLQEVWFSLEGFKVARHTKANSEGVKTERTAIRVVPKGRFVPISSTRELVGRLFGLREPASGEARACPPKAACFTEAARAARR